MYYVDKLKEEKTPVTDGGWYYPVLYPHSAYAAMITHIGGLDCAAETTLRQPEIPGGKKLIYTHARLPLTAIADFEKLGERDPLFARLAEAVARGGGLWNDEAERILLASVGE